MAKANVCAHASAINTVYPPEIIAFARFVATLADMVATERHLSKHSARDPDIDAAILVAERARATTLDRLDVVLAVSRSAPSELRGVALLFRAALSSEHPSEVTRLRDLARSCLQKNAPDPENQTEDLLSRMLQDALEGLEAYLALEDGDQEVTVVADEPQHTTHPAPKTVLAPSA